VNCPYKCNWLDLFNRFVLKAVRLAPALLEEKSVFFKYSLLGEFFMIAKRREGHPLKDTVDMQLWLKEFEKLSISDHEEKLRGLGLDKEDIEEFKKEAETKKKPAKE
jgi:hypothetical protein